MDKGRHLKCDDEHLTICRADAMDGVLFFGQGELLRNIAVARVGFRFSYQDKSDAISEIRLFFLFFIIKI